MAYAIIGNQMNTLDIVNWCNEQMQINQIQDYGPNGLQVAGKQHIKKIVSGVTACQALIDAAIDVNADMLLVHHGLFWDKDERVVTGMLRNRLASLLAADLNLLAYHLPLDLHLEWGNNIQLAKQLGINFSDAYRIGPYPTLGALGALPTAMPSEALADHLFSFLGREPLHIPGHDRPIETVAWCTGAAQDGIVEAAKQGADAYLSGEISERTVHQARELKIDYYACGHHATERYGVQAFGEYLADFFDLEHQFIDIENPV